MERIKMLREERNMTQKELAAAIGVDRTAIAKYETGASGAKSEVLEKLADYFQVSTDYLLERTDKKTPAADNGDGQDKDEMTELLQSLRERPELKMLFDAGKKATPDTVRATAQFLEGLAKNNEYPD